MILQLSEMIPVSTPLGDGYATIFESCDHDNWWTVILNNGAIVTFSQDKIRAKRCYTHGRNFTDEEMKKIIE